MNDRIPQDVPLPPPPPEAPKPHPDAPATIVRKKKARRRVVMLIGAGILAIAAFWYFEHWLSLPLAKVRSIGNSIESSVSDMLPQSFSAPGPLAETGGGAPRKTNELTAQGIIAQTNAQRAQNDLPPLADDATLDAIAQLRLDDMFEKQYFAHVGPQGESALTVASSVGYAHLALGENLALGLYNGDVGVVDAWMASPGHRANILDTHYTQIGVAAREGMFNGRETWIAVQIFGRPASACPMPDANLKTSIDLSENQLSAMAAQLASDKTAIDAMNPQAGPAYNAQAEDYNNLAAQYNDLASQTAAAVGEYNSQVTAFNTCLSE